MAAGLVAAGLVAAAVAEERLPAALVGLVAPVPGPEVAAVVAVELVPVAAEPVAEPAASGAP